MHLLLVEDDPRLARSYQRNLEEEGHTVEVAFDGEAGYQRALAGRDKFDAVILDVLLPKRNGIAVCRDLRRAAVQTPILLLTALDQTEDKVAGLDAGADDYLSKPFDLGELIARAKALIRRGKGAAHPVLSVGDIEVNTLEQSVRRSGQVIDLSPMEYRILEYLIHRPRVVVSKRELLEHLYDYNWEHHSNVIEAHVSNLRKKLDAGSRQPSIETLRGRGYRLAIA